jgi:hypothetical protein
MCVYSWGCQHRCEQLCIHDCVHDVCDVQNVHAGQHIRGDAHDVKVGPHNCHIHDVHAGQQLCDVHDMHADCDEYGFPRCSQCMDVHDVANVYNGPVNSSPLCSLLYDVLIDMRSVK